MALQAQSDAAREVFARKSDLGLLSYSRESLRLIPYLCSSSNLQQQINSYASPTNCGGCQSPTARKINKTKGNRKNKVSGERTESKSKVKQSKSN
jgi:hypothetical protein